jgi:hypothetical protein
MGLEIVRSLAFPRETINIPQSHRLKFRPHSKMRFIKAEQVVSNGTAAYEHCIQKGRNWNL